MEFIFLNRELMAFNQDLIKSLEPVAASNNENHSDTKSEIENKINLMQIDKKIETKFLQNN